MINYLLRPDKLFLGYVFITISQNSVVPTLIFKQNQSVIISDVHIPPDIVSSIKLIQLVKAQMFINGIIKSCYITTFCVPSTKLNFT